MTRTRFAAMAVTAMMALSAGCRTGQPIFDRYAGEPADAGNDRGDPLSAGSGGDPIAGRARTRGCVGLAGAVTPPPAA